MSKRKEIYYVVEMMKASYEEMRDLGEKSEFIEGALWAHRYALRVMQNMGWIKDGYIKREVE